MKENKKQTKGITLIALVITIIVLLILAGVSIAMLTGQNGILTQAQNANEETEDAKILEEIKIKVTEYQTLKYTENEKRTLSEFLKDELDLESIRETKYETLVFKVGDKIVSVYKDNTVEIKDYQSNTLANNAPRVASQTNTEMTENDGFLTDDGLARKYVKEIIFNINNEIPSSYDKSWDVSEIEDGSVMAYASGDEVNGYNVTIVANGEIYMPENSMSLFELCGFNENLPEYSIYLTGVNTSKVKNMHNIFCKFGYYSMTSFRLGDDFDVANVSDMEGMFGYCGYNAMTSLNLGNNFNTSNVQIMTSMFWNCGYNAMESLNLGNNFDTSNVTDMSGIFGHCGHNALTSLDLGDKFNTSKVTDMHVAFYDCGYNAMTSLNLGNNFDTSNVTNMADIFNTCGYMALTELNLGEKFNTSSVTNMNRAFTNCGYNNMEEINLGNAFKETSKLTDIIRILSNCGTQNCKYYVNSEEGATWLLNLDSSYRRNENWNNEYIVIL